MGRTNFTEPQCLYNTAKAPNTYGRAASKEPQCFTIQFYL